MIYRILLKWDPVIKYIQSPSFLRILIPSIWGISVIAYYAFHNYLKVSLGPIKPKISPSAQFLEDRKKQFLELWYETSATANANIDHSFYDYEQYKNMMDRNTNIEKLWKSRMLFDITPSGNVIMYYDVYKHGFVYASDQTIPYTVLCGCAMKYCKIFYCRDFFRDNLYIPDYQLSPFTLMDLDQEKIEKRKKIQKRKELRIDFHSDAFLRPKPKPKSNQDTNQTEKEPKIPLKDPSHTITEKDPGEITRPKDFYKNIFQFVGKMRNVSLLQSQDYMRKIHEPNENIGSYSSFKKKKHKHECFNNFFMVDHVDMNVIKYG